MDNCGKYITGEDYIDLLYRRSDEFNPGAEGFRDYCVTQIDDRWGIIHLNRNETGEVNYGNFGYTSFPVVYGVQDYGAIGAAGITQVREQPFLALRGTGTLIGIVDTGIRYEHEVFVREDGSSIIDAVWDQTAEKTAQNVDEMTENVKQLAVTSDKMDQSRERAEKIITELSESNVDTVDAASRMNRQIHITNDAAVRIQKAIQIITSIADETNLLSLNASIEAARAGEQGKGFAVVANQIQTLAEQSGESAKEIEEITAELLQESTQAVSIMEEMQNIVGEEAEKLEETKQQFMNVSDGVTETRNETQNMRQKTKECAGVRQEMMDVISNLSAVSEENAASTQETTASMQVLNDTIATQADSAGNLSNLSKSMDQQLKFFEL